MTVYCFTANVSISFKCLWSRKLNKGKNAKATIAATITTTTIIKQKKTQSNRSALIFLVHYTNYISVV